MTDTANTTFEHYMVLSADPEFVRGYLASQESQERILRVARLTDFQIFWGELARLPLAEQIIVPLMAQAMPDLNFNTTEMIRSARKSERSDDTKTYLRFLKARLMPGSKTFDQEWRNKFLIALYDEIIAMFKQRGWDTALPETQRAKEMR